MEYSEKRVEVQPPIVVQAESGPPSMDGGQIRKPKNTRPMLPKEIFFDTSISGQSSNRIGTGKKTSIEATPKYSSSSMTGNDSPIVYIQVIEQ